MSNKKELEHKLEQCIRDRKLGISKADEEIARIRQKIADTEVTYSIGDRFEANGAEYILAATCSNCDLIAVNLRTGNSCNGVKKVAKRDAVTTNEIERLFGYFSFTRIHSIRKQVNV